MEPWPGQNSAEPGFLQCGIHSTLVKGHIHLGICGLAFVPGPCTFFLSFFHITMCSCWERDLLFLLRNTNQANPIQVSRGPTII